jgi:predicted acetyltransferase
MEAKLIKPNLSYKDSFYRYVTEYKENDEHYYGKYKRALDNFEHYIDELEKRTCKEDSNHTITYWLVDQGEVVGVVRIRTKEDPIAGNIGYDISPRFRKRGYGHLILKLALLKVKELELDEVFLTCYIKNVASRKIIEKNNGIKIGQVFDEEDDIFLDRFKISLA